MEEDKDIQELKETDNTTRIEKLEKFLQDYKDFIEEWRVKLEEIESTLSKDSSEELEEISLLKKKIATLQSSNPSFEDFLIFCQKLTCSDFFSKYNRVKQNNQSEFIRNKEQEVEDIKTCCNLHKTLRSNTPTEDIESLLNRLLSYAKDLDPVQVLILINSILKDIESFDLLEISTNRSKDDLLRVKKMLVDFIYQFKDKRPRLQSKGALDVFNLVMDFVCKHRLKPSIELQEKYSKTELNKLLQFPSHEFLKERIDMEDDVYNDLKKVYDSIGHFNYFFDSDIPLRTVPIEEDGFEGVEISHRTEETNECYGAGINIFSDGQVFQGYFKNGERYFNGRLFWPDGETHNASFYEGYKTGYCETKIYIGTCLKEKYQGKGRYNFESKYLNCSEFKIRNFHGPTTQYFVNGDIKICMYQDDDKINLD